MTSLCVTLVLLLLTDAGLRSWSRFPDRLPEHFSPVYLQRYVEHAKSGKDVIAVVGDSVLWGYGVPSRDTVVAQLRRRFPEATVLNLSYEAGSPINADFMVRYLLARGIKPKAVLLDLNPISFNQLSKAYDTLNVALERLALPSLLEPFDRDRLSADDSALHPSPVDRADRFMENHWLLYGARVDLHQWLFGAPDAATALWMRSPFASGAATGSPLQMFGSYSAMYDLTPLSRGNISYAYTEHLFKTLAAARVPAIAVLTPTNHGLLHSYIDVAAYGENLRRLKHLGESYGISMMNLDRLLPSRDFIDNTHLRRAGSIEVAKTLSPEIARAVHVF